MSEMFEDQGGANKREHTVYSLFTENTPSVVTNLLRSSFYLPKEIYHNPRYVITTSILTQNQWEQLRDKLEKNYESTLHFADMSALVNVARHVGLSTRVDTKIGKVHRIVKIWWGKPPSNK